MKNGAVFSRLRHDAVFCVIFKVGFYSGTSIESGRIIGVCASCSYLAVSASWILSPSEAISAVCVSSSLTSSASKASALAVMESMYAAYDWADEMVSITAGWLRSVST